MKRSNSMISIISVQLHNKYSFNYKGNNYKLQKWKIWYFLTDETYGKVFPKFTKKHHSFITVTLFTENQISWI